MRGLALYCGYDRVVAMKGLKQVAIVGLSIAIFLPITASAATWVLPSGLVYDDSTNTIVQPLKVAAPKLAAKPACPKTTGSKLKQFLLCK